MNLTHLHTFLDAMMRRKDLEAMLSHMADDIVLKTPLAIEPLAGKTAIRPVVAALLSVVDRFDLRELMQGPEHVAVCFGITVGLIELDGMDYFRLNEAGLVREMTVFWRPLPSILAVQEKLARA